MAAGSAADLLLVAQVEARLQALLGKARTVKSETTVEPPLPVADFTEDVGRVLDSVDSRYDHSFRSALVETAARQIFADIIASTDISDPEFVQMWNLLDIMTICGDRGNCEPAVAGWLIEELLDSQTTAGCRRVFDYMESRAARLSAKDFHKKNVVFLRMCNELLRRLSKAEDAMFCGRVFFFLFHTYPLGDQSSVNRTGDFHVENTTTFELSKQDGDKMEVDAETPRTETPQPPSKPGQKAIAPKAVKKAEEIVLSNDELYPIFWRLQHDFSDPIKLFDGNNFAAFKKGLDHTITKFKKTPAVVQTRADAETKRGTKRKQGESETVGEDRQLHDHFSDNYNPKYLTSRELFDLELSDLAFQRHIMVQAWILMDFLLSLTDKAKKRALAEVEKFNRAILYSYTLSEEDTKWCTETRDTVMAYLASIPNQATGRFYHRMVATILDRDKNWVRWKAESCPTIVRDPVPAEKEMEARNGAAEATRPRRIPARAPGAMDWSFLEEGHGGGLDALRNPRRVTAPSTEELINGIRNDKLDLEMADDAEREALESAIANKTWRALRQVRATNYRFLDKVDPTKPIEDAFTSPPTPPPEEEDLKVDSQVGEDDRQVGNEALDSTARPLDDDVMDGTDIAAVTVNADTVIEQPEGKDLASVADVRTAVDNPTDAPAS
ncbi:THO complex subunit 1 [Teratosphaeria destructans]|uniref:THO complex subunit 1 n=1 Tax=Teratosphaeria destructans TaxID=418781 RepID=A0A9W7W6G3_9PEZI|nr:THO complex subunit 1 [Teratosphaeria destructans]